MQSLGRVIRSSAGDQHLIELPFAGLQRMKFGLTRGKTAMIAAAPGVGKSALTLALVLDLGLPTLYASPDTDAWTVTVRAMAHLTGHPQEYIRQCLEGGYAKADIALALEDAAHVQFTFDAHTTEDLLQDVQAYATVHGAWPELIVVDNLRNLARGGDDDLSSQQKAVDELDALAANTGACVIILHHSTGAYDDGDKPIPLSGLENKLSKLPAHVLTIHRKDTDMFLCPVKNRAGQCDPTAKKQVRVFFDGERMAFRDGSG
jgi:replicative DNA helicase